MWKSLKEWHRDLEERLSARFSVEQRLAMKFTRLVCVFVLVSGMMFTAADAAFSAYQVRQDLNAQIDKVLEGGAVAADIAAAGSAMTATVRAYTRILAPDGTVLYAGALFSGISGSTVDPFVPLSLDGARYLVVTRAVRSDGRIVGYVQFAGPTGNGRHEAAWRLLNLLLTTLIMSILAYVFGLSFSRHTLRPIHESQERLEQFTQDASHELRTPLASISSSLDVAMKTGEYEQGIMAAKGQVKYASLLVERLLEVAQLDRASVDLGPIDMTALVCSAASQSVEPGREHDVTMRTAIEENVVVEGDGLLLHQLVSNLIENAVKFNVPGGDSRCNPHAHGAYREQLRWSHQSRGSAPRVRALLPGGYFSCAARVWIGTGNCEEGRGTARMATQCVQQCRSGYAIHGGIHAVPWAWECSLTRS